MGGGCVKVVSKAKFLISYANMWSSLIGLGKVSGFITLFCSPAEGRRVRNPRKPWISAKKPNMVRKCGCQNILQFLFLGGVRNNRELVCGCY